MKTFVAFSTAAVLCLLAFVQTAVAQGEGYFCSGPFNICNVQPCIREAGNCSTMPNVSYAGYSVDLNMMTTTCASGFGSCYLQPEPVTACAYVYYITVNFLGNCSNQCGVGGLSAYVCPL